MISFSFTRTTIILIIVIALSSIAYVKCFTVTPSSPQQQSHNNKVTIQTTKRAVYDCGIGKNQPVISSTFLHHPVQTVHNNNIDPFVFLVDHNAVNDIVSENIWRKRYETTSTATTTKVTEKQKLPTVVLNRFTNNNEILLLDENTYQYSSSSTSSSSSNSNIRASAKTKIRRNYDLNTPWIDILIFNEKQKLRQQILTAQQQIATATASATAAANTKLLQPTTI